MVLQSVPESDHRPEDEALRENSPGQSPLPGSKEGGGWDARSLSVHFHAVSGKNDELIC